MPYTLAKRFIPTWLAMRFERPTPRRLGSLAPVLHEVVEKLEAVKPAVPARTDFHCEAPAMTPLPAPAGVSGKKRSTVLAKLLATDPKAIPRAEKALAIAWSGWSQTWLRLPARLPPPARDPDEHERARRYAEPTWDPPRLVHSAEVVELHAPPPQAVLIDQPLPQAAPALLLDAPHVEPPQAALEAPHAPHQPRTKRRSGAAQKPPGSRKQATPARLTKTQVEALARKFLVTRLEHETQPVPSATLRKEWRRGTKYSDRVLQKAAQDLGMEYTQVGKCRWWSLPKSS